MDLQISTKEQILKDCLEIDAFLNITCSEQIEEISDRGNDLNAYLARTVKMLADAKYHLNTAKSSDIMDILRETAKKAKVTSTAINELVKSASKDEQYLVDFCDRLNAACTHQIDWCRTLISKAKTEMQYSRGF